MARLETGGSMWGQQQLLAWPRGRTRHDTSLPSLPPPCPLPPCPWLGLQGNHKSPMEYIQSTEPRKVHGLVVASYGCEWVGRGAALPLLPPRCCCRCCCLLALPLVGQRLPLG